MNVKLLTEHQLQFLRLKGGSSESTLVKMPHYWKSHVMAHIFILGNSREKAENSGGHPRGVRSSETRTAVKTAVRTVNLEKESLNSPLTAPGEDTGRGQLYSSRLQKLCGIFNVVNLIVVLCLVLL